jgi:hypothetical protein
MKYVSAMAALIVVLLFSSCVSYQMIPVESEDTIIRTNRGSQILISSRDVITVAASAEITEKKVYLHLLVKNNTDQFCGVNDADVKLIEWSEETGTRSLYVYHADEYYQKRRKEIITGQVLMAISAALSSFNAGYSTYNTYGNDNYSGYDRSGYYSGFGSYTGTATVYSSSQAALEREIAFSRAQNYINGGNAELEYLKNTLFYPSEIAPHDEYYGIIVAEMGATSSSQMEYTIVIAGERIVLRFNKEDY